MLITMKMSLESERKIKFWLSTIVKILVVILIIYKLIPLVLKNNNAIKTEDDNMKISEIKPTIKENSFKSNLGEDSIMNFIETKKVTKKYFQINELIQYKGKILENAYFTIGNCNNCISSITGVDGMAKLNVPYQYFEDDNVLDFYIFTSDTLVYHKAMRLTNVQFNKY